MATVTGHGARCGIGALSTALGLPTATYYRLQHTLMRIPGANGIRIGRAQSIRRFSTRRARRCRAAASTRSRHKTRGSRIGNSAGPRSASHGHKKRQVLEMYREEQPALQRLPAEHFQMFIHGVRSVDDAGMLAPE